MFSGWVGDQVRFAVGVCRAAHAHHRMSISCAGYAQDPTFEGFQQAFANIIYSAWYNYTNFGSDIGERV
jgi:hypothetical protein